MVIDTCCVVDTPSPEGRSTVLERLCRTYCTNSGALIGETQETVCLRDKGYILR